MVVFPITIDGRPAVLEIKNVESASDKLGDSLGALAAVVGRLEARLEEQAKATKQATQATKEETKATEEEARAQKDAEKAIKDAVSAKEAKRRATENSREAIRRATAENERYENSVDGIRRGMIGARGALLGLVAVGGLSLGLRGATTLLGEYSEKTAVLGVVSRATAEDQARLGRQALLLGESTRYTASQAVDAQIALARAGLQANEVLGATPAVLALATVGQVSLGEAATYTANSLRQFGIDASQAERVADSLVIVSNRANTDVRQMAEALAYAGPVAKAAGRSLEETAAAIGVLGDAGITGSMGGTNLRGMLSDLLSRNDVTERALARLGLTFEQVNPLTQDLASLFQTLRERGFGATEAIEIFGDRNAAAALVMADNVAKLRELTAAQSEFSGEAMKGAEVIEGNLKGAYLGLASAVEGATLKKGGGFLGDLLRGVIDTSTDAVRVLFGLSQETQRVGLMGQVAAVGIGTLTASLLALGAAKVIGGVVALGTALSTSLATFIPLVLLSNPVGLLTGGLVALTATVGAGYFAWDAYADSAERSRLAFVALRNEAEGFRKSLDDVAAATSRVRDLRISEHNGNVDLSSQGFLDRATAHMESATAWEGMLRTLRAKRDSGWAPDRASAAAGLSMDAVAGILGEEETRRIRLGAKSAALGIPQQTVELAETWGGSGGADWARAEIAGMEAAIAAVIEHEKAREASARSMAAETAEKERARQTDYAAAAERAKSTLELEKVLELEQRRIDLMASGDSAGMLRLEFGERYADQIKSMGDAAGAVLDRLVALAQARKRLDDAANDAQKKRAMIAAEERAAEARRTAAERSIAGLDDTLSLESRRFDLLRSGDMEQQIRFETQREFADALFYGGEAAEAQAEALVQLRLRHIELEDQMRRSELHGPEAPGAPAVDDTALRTLSDLADQRAMFGMTPDQRERRQMELQMLQSGASGDQIEQAGRLVDELQALRQIETVAFGIGDALAGGLERAVFQGGKLRDILRATALDIYQVMFRSLVSQPIASGVGSGLSGLFGSIFAPGASGAGEFVGPPRPFASGGFPEIITRPTTFAMRGGREGIAGESGPEWAIAPLRRTSRGELGVSIAEGAPRGGDSIVIQNTFNGVPDQQTAQLAAARVRTQMERALRDRRGPRS